MEKKCFVTDTGLKKKRDDQSTAGGGTGGQRYGGDHRRKERAPANEPRGGDSIW